MKSIFNPVSSLSYAESKIDLVKICLQHRCVIDDNWSLNALQRWFFTAKTIICIAFGLEWKGKLLDWYCNDPVIVGMHGFRKFYNYEVAMQDASFIDITVAHKWNIWRYSEISDGWL